MQVRGNEASEGARDMLGPQTNALEHPMPGLSVPKRHLGLGLHDVHVITSGSRVA